MILLFCLAKRPNTECLIDKSVCWSTVWLCYSWQFNQKTCISFCYPRWWFWDEGTKVWMIFFFEIIKIMVKVNLSAYSTVLLFLFSLFHLQKCFFFLQFYFSQILIEYDRLGNDANFYITLFCLKHFYG